MMKQFSQSVNLWLSIPSIRPSLHGTSPSLWRTHYRSGERDEPLRSSLPARDSLLMELKIEKKIIVLTDCLHFAKKYAKSEYFSKKGNSQFSNSIVYWLTSPFISWRQSHRILHFRNHGCFLIVSSSSSALALQSEHLVALGEHMKSHFINQPWLSYPSRLFISLQNPAHPHRIPQLP